MASLLDIVPEQITAKCKLSDVNHTFVVFEVGLHISLNAFLQNPYLFSYRIPARCITD